jgi:2-polyprenyl-6-hydroxyphenyl methylase / 3-demethylubiquinone-9 3-methyltransferase
LKSYLLSIVGAEYVLNLLPRGTHTYERFIRPSELARWSRVAGLSLEDVSGLSYDPFSNTAKISRNVDVNYLMCLRRELSL